ncbi:FAD-binding domain-containing protein [Hydrotalea sp.]|uniref:FAD-binding domain-containing protein n=1 Tax=Hydrotalea sp. TaxID=2881279 RepID=UPI00261C848F|nr:FAD-binding domain-containing protein [Hydrotalea sp.]
MRYLSTDYPSILQAIDVIEPIAYAQTRNYLNGKVTYLSPYLSRGVISTRQILQHLILQKFTFSEVKVLLQELAWRDYYQRIWQEKGAQINQNIFQLTRQFHTNLLPTSILEATTGITVIDTAIQQMYQTGYMHNHCRMYTASMACNVAQTHWLIPAKWMYYYLMDGDWASNALSWQWVAGTFSSKQYVANQENMNRFTGTRQYHTFLDVPYEQLPLQIIPQVLQHRSSLQLSTTLPNHLPPLQINPLLPTLIYNYYNLSATWHQHTLANRILLLEPALFQQYPVSDKCIHFALELAQNIPGIQCFAGSFEALINLTGKSTIIYREHPLNQHYQGEIEPREWMVPEVKGYFPSFFSYWKKITKKLESYFQP